MSAQAPSRALTRRQLLRQGVQLAGLTSLGLGVGSSHASDGVERAQHLGADAGKTNLRVAVPALHSTPAFPLWCAERLGMFARQGLALQLQDEASDELALRRLQRGESDFALVGLSSLICNSLDDANQWRVVLQLWRSPQTALLVSRRVVQRYLAPAQLAGLRIGLGTSGVAGSHLVRSVLAAGGLAPDAVQWVSLGSAEGALTAMEHLQVDALVAQDPVVSLLERDFPVQVAADTRSLQGIRGVFESGYAGACLVARTAAIGANTARTQAVVQAVLLAMKWLETAQTADWAKVMPTLPHLGQRSDHILAWEKARSALSADGQPLEGDVSAVLASMRQLKLKPTFDGDWRRVVAPQFVQRAKIQAT